MPNKAIVSGILMDATLAPVSEGKIVATLSGSDIFDGGMRIVTQKVEATTNQNGEWTLELIVNGEGDTASTTWTIEGYNQYVAKVFEVKSLFIASQLAVTLGDLEKTSAQNLKAAKDASVSRLLVVADFSEYATLPQSQKRESDIVLVRGTYNDAGGNALEGFIRIYFGGQRASLLDTDGNTVIDGEASEPPSVTRQPSLLPLAAGIGDSMTLDIGTASGSPAPVANWELRLDGLEISHRVDAFMALELAEPGNYELFVSWANGVGDPIAATTASLTVEAEAEVPPAAVIDYAGVALAYFDADTDFVGTAEDVTSVTALGTGGYRFAKTGSGAVTRTEDGFVFSDGAYLQSQTLSGQPTTDGLFVVAEVTLSSYGSNIGQIVDGQGQHVKLRNNGGTLQATSQVGTPTVLALGSAIYGSRMVIAGQLDDVADLFSAFNLSGNEISAASSMTDPALTRVSTGRYLNGTIHRLAIIGRPEGQPWPVTMQEVHADFHQGA